MKEIQKRLYSTGVIPVSVIKNVEDADKVCEALLGGGIDVIEVTLRTEGAERVIEEIKKNFPQMLVGAGTVLNTEQVKTCESAGADFIVTPGFDERVVECCQKKKLPIFPGCTTATEYQAAYNYSLEVLKFFPAEQSGGVGRIKALAAPYPNFKIIPTGGVSLDNIGGYLSEPCVLACGGSYMVAQKLIAEKKWDKIKEFTEMSVAKVKEARGSV